MTDDELRDLVRDAIARHVQRGSTGVERAPSPLVEIAFGRHASHVLLPVPGGSEGDGVCLIEPAVRCAHCGYCQSYGH